MGKVKEVLITIIVILFILENLLIGYGYYLNAKENQGDNECKSFCIEYDYYLYDKGVCDCYESLPFEDLEADKTKVIG